MYYHVLQRITIVCPSNVNVMARSMEHGAWSSRLLVVKKICHPSPVTRHLSKIKEKR